MERDVIKVVGARENNLKNISIEIPKNKLVVMTGVSGSGKTSLAFDTLYQEGQRRYMESLNAYARQFLGNFEKPDVDSIDGLSPSISIDQKTTSNNPRSTVGTVTEIYDYLRLIYARIGRPYCPGSDEPVVKYSIEAMTKKVLELEEGSKIYIMAPIVENTKAEYDKLFDEWQRSGYARFYLDGKVYLLEERPKISNKEKHQLYLIIDRLVVKDGIRSRVYDSLELASKLANGKTKVWVNDTDFITMNQNYVCDTDFTIPDLEPRLFSFNTPLGACPVCRGLGINMKISQDLVVDYNKSLRDGGILPYKNNDEDSLNILELETLCNHYDIDMDTEIRNIPKDKLNIVLYGSKEKLEFNMKSSSGRLHMKKAYYEGIIVNLERRYLETTSEWIRTWIESFMTESVCYKCHGARLNEGALSVKIGGKNIYEMTLLSIEKMLDFLKSLELNNEEKQIAKLAFNEIESRLSFLSDVGLNYLTLARTASTLSGGEAQRIRLATQIGSKLTGVMYVLDEPSIGLHQKDNDRLIDTLKKMRDLGNSLIVVEHDHDTMLAADYLIDIGPRAGLEGGHVVSAGTPEEVMKDKNSLTGKYLTGELNIEVPEQRRKGTGNFIKVRGARANNLKNIDVDFPLGEVVVVTGVSGSGKSSLVNEILLKGLLQKYYKNKDVPGDHDKIDDNNMIEKVVEISQSPIGRTPRSNPATYTGVFDDIRDLFTNTNEAKARGYQKGRFSFNLRGGRCEACNGDGVKKISMHFLPDVFVPCEVCHGKRYNHETLQIKYRGASIADVLDMSVLEAAKFFENHPKISHKLNVLVDVGLDYIKLGQPAPSLSGGEAQRVKLASELYKKITDKTIYILDEPTTGLHTDDVKKLLKVFNKIVDEGATMVIIEHNLDVIKSGDYIIDLGLEGGEAGGYIVSIGTPEEIAKSEVSYTGKYLKKVLKGADKLE
ncbi:excinuclease ABC subunit UvrA [Haploplasma axanthum]|uniref:UvrABC system protein A n=1 Tax=Haploplasma axanthum TaxID=29552 RepID=A0A449BB80_HAPAX|nr:excinuclease ABC subunit UvrA [Haploplasma axanthum]VEU79579.1 ABC transporter ATPase [Haploplasma axanthum]